MSAEPRGALGREDHGVLAGPLCLPRRSPHGDPRFRERPRVPADPSAAPRPAAWLPGYGEDPEAQRSQACKAAKGVGPGFCVHGRRPLGPRQVSVTRLTLKRSVSE